MKSYTQLPQNYKERLRIMRGQNNQYYIWKVQVRINGLLHKEYYKECFQSGDTVESIKQFIKSKESDFKKHLKDYGQESRTHMVVNSIGAYALISGLQEGNVVSITIRRISVHF